MPGGSGAGMSMEVSKIVLKLETNFQQVLKQQINSFDKFTRDANQLTRQVGTNMNQLARTTSKTFSAVYKSNRKEIQEFVSFTRNALQGVRKETLQMQAFQERLEKATIARYRKMRSEMAAVKRKSDLVSRGTGFTEEQKKSAFKAFEKQKQDVEDRFKASVDKMTEQVKSLMIKHLAGAVKESMKTIEKGSRSAAVTVNNVVNDMEKRFKQLWRRRGIMPQADLAQQGSSFLKQRAEQIKVLESLLSAHQKKQVQAEQYLEKQKRLLSEQTNKTLIRNQKQMVNEARAVVKKLGGEYEFMFNSIQKFARGQTALTGVFKTQAEQGIAAIKQTLRGVNLKRDFEKMWVNLEQTARLAGEKSGKAFYDSVRKGKALDQALIEKRKHLENLLKIAKQLQATGLIDASKQIARLKTVIGGLKEFRTEYGKVKKEMSAIPEISFQQFYKGGAQQARNLAVEVRKAVAVLKQLGPVTEHNVIEVQRQLKIIQGLYKQHGTKVVATQKVISKLEEQILMARAKVRNATNKASIASWEAYERKVKAIIKLLNESLRKSVLPRDPYDQYKKDTLATLQMIRTEVAKSLLPTAKIKADSKIIQNEYKRIGQRMDELSKKRMVSPRHMSEAKGFIDKLENKVKEYNAQIVLLSKQLERLRRIQKTTFGGAGLSDQISGMKTRMKELQQMVRQYERAQIQMQRRMSVANRQSLKSMLQSGWEMIRNFRWQVAAVIYLITRAVRAVKRVFFDVMGEIAKYRREAMTLAAQFSFKMLGDMEKNFESVYQYSRQLMNKMEQEAARTILTMEDMTMLVRTFSQAGFVPDPNKDVRKIAIIGTAIKTLTEGMANAGTQMRQELYAIIAGRQRATDQLAMMFQMMGTDIQKIIQEEKAGGKEMIDSLSEALAPFGVLNTKLANEWEAIVNKMKLAWQVIKRIGLEDSLLRVTKEFSDFTDKYYSTTMGITKEGRKVAAALRSAFEIVKAPIKVIGELFGVLKEQWNLFFGIIRNVYGSFATITNSLDGVSKSMKGILTLTEVVLKTFIVLRGVIRLFSKVLGIVYTILTAIHGIIIDITKWVVGKLVGAVGYIADKLSFGVLGAGLEKMKGLMGDLIPDDLKKEWDEVNDIVKEMRHNLQQLNKVPIDIQKHMKLKYDPMQVVDMVGKFENQIDEMELAGLDTKERAIREYKMRIKEIEWLKTAATSNLQTIQAYYNEMKAMGIEFTEDDEKRLKGYLKAHSDALAKVVDYERFAKRDQNKILADFYEKQRQQMAGWKKQAETFWESITPKDLTREQKTEKWFNKLSARLDELKVKNPLVTAEFKKFSDQLDEALGQRKLDDAAAINNEMEKMKLTLTSHRPVDAISKINTEFEKMKLKIVSNKDFIAKGLTPEMMKLWEITKKERIEVERLNMAYQASSASMEVMSARASFLIGSYSPAKKMQGEIQQLKINYKKELLAIQKEIDKTYRMWVENGQWSTREGSAEAQKYVKALQEQMEELTKVTERELKKKQMPIWNDLVEASNNWADGFTDSLSQIVDGVDSVSEALNQLQTQILKDTLKIIIKRGVTDQLQSALGSGSESPMAGFFGMFPGGKAKEGKVQEITATKPIPVTVYNTQDLMDGTFKSMSKLEEIPSEGIVGSKVFVTNWPIGGGGASELFSSGIGEVTETGVQGVSQDLADISAEIADNTEAASQSSKSWYSDITNTFSQMGSWISSLFSSGGGGGGSSTGSSVGGLAMTAVSAYGRAYGGGGYGFAEGGVISEPIVGKGLQSGEVYNFGERSKYGENEIVAPMKKLQKSAPQNKYSYHMPIHISAIDTQTGVQFLMRNSDVIQGQMVKNLKQNKPIRKGIQNSY